MDQPRPDEAEPTLRVTARVLPVNHRGEVLLLQDQDPGRPGILRWGTIGGAVDPGETLLEAAVREKLARFAERLTRIEIHVRDENGAKGGADDKACTIEARPAGGRAIGVTEHAAKVDDAARKAAATLAQRLDRHFGKSDRNNHAPRPDKVL